MKISSGKNIGIPTIVVMCVLVSAANAQQLLTYRDLVQQMTNLERLAILPADGEQCALASSYDRASQYDAETGQYQKWDANADGDGIIRKEGNQAVLAEMEGPGCIWRIWSAKAEQGHVKIFLDGQEAPAVDLPFAQYFTGDTAPFAYPELSYDLNKHNCSGQNLYFPIPYQKSCKVVADEGWGRYFQFTYVTYPKGTKVPTFSAQLAAENSEALTKVQNFYQSQLGTDPAGKRSGEESVAKTITVAKGSSVRFCDLAGSRAITAIRMKGNFKDRADQMAALRKLAISIRWDDETKPSVWSPLGDFFGTAPGENLYKSMVTGMMPGGYYAYWYMPFARNAAVDLINDDDQDRELTVEVVHAPLSRPFDGLGHFHAKWHRDMFPLSADRFPDWVMMRATGRGRFCGVMLHVWNPMGGWWGEGDEKFFVDGETFPSTIGTGSEDYFGYAWCNPGYFQRPFHAQSMTENNNGHQSVLRWHVLDNVPFQHQFEACIEKYFKNKENGTLFACLVTWYLAPGGKDPFEAVPVAHRCDYWPQPQKIVAGIEVLGRTPGSVQPQIMTEMKGNWKDNDQLFWTNGQPGNKLDIAVNVAKTGDYGIAATLTKACDYAIVQFELDGEKLGKPIDLYNPEVILTDAPQLLGTRHLLAGQHKLTVEIVGANEKAKKSYMFGLDELFLEPCQQ